MKKKEETYEEQIKEVEEKYSKLAKKYCEDPKTCPSDEFFAKIHRVWDDYKNVSFAIINV